MNRMPRSIHAPGASHKAPIPAAARVANVLCTSAVSGKDPLTGDLPADMEAQVIHAFVNLAAVLGAGGAGLEHLVKLSVTLHDNAARDAVNAQWLAMFPDPNDRPARHIVVHELQHGMWLQLEAMAVIS